MQVQSSQSTHLINALQYCHFTNPISDKLIIALSEKLELCPKLLAQQLIHRVEQLPYKNSDPLKTIDYINSALSQSFKISNKLKERIALKMGVAVSTIHQ